MKNTETAVKALLGYGMETGLICREDLIFTANGLFDVLHFEPDEQFGTDGIPQALLLYFEKAGVPVKPLKDLPISLKGHILEQILKDLLDDAVQRGVIEESITARDLLDTRIMGVLTPRPREVIRTFWENYAESPEKATDSFYALSVSSDYIRSYRIEKDQKWTAHTPYGDLDITINLSKPEKDPKAIAAALTNKGKASYPKCLLCHSNEGYAGRLDHPARQTIRHIPLTLGGEAWYMQYSPYVYYNEHCIVFSDEHRPMKIDRQTFVRLLEFIKLFPHYTVGSNADLPIVGGSILTHEHYQGGRYTFAMARADVREVLHFQGYEDVSAGIINWPMSVIRISGTDPERLINLADRILQIWRNYSDPASEILAQTDAPHNTITPIARMREGRFELDLVLRNNRTTDEYPLGIFHPHSELHHIKKENIGLIEVMGLAVLPSRLLTEMQQLKEALLRGADLRKDAALAPHADWAEEIMARRPEASAENLDAVLRDEIGIAFSKVLAHAGVYKDTPEGREGFDRFIAAVNAEISGED